MKDEYTIINKSVLEKRIEELEKEIKFLQAKDAYEDIGKISAYKKILSQSTPLIPEIEKAYTEGMLFGTSKLLNRKTKEEYISNLKLNI